MKRKIPSVIVSFIVGIFAFIPLIIPASVQADDFDFVTFFFERTKVSEDGTPILVVLEPSTATAARTETTFRVTFKAGFGVNSNASAIQTSTSGLPTTFKGNTLTAMPGLSATASGVSGQQVDFTISDLTDGNYYAFYITSGITNPSSAGNYVSPVETRDGGGTIDSASPGFGIEDDDQLTVTATVPPKSNSGVVSIARVESTSAVAFDGDTLTFEVSYKNADSQSYPFNLVASWEKGVVEGTSSQVEVFDYVIGSAEDTDDGTTPVVDLQNRKITWTIPSLAPSDELKTVRFKLKVRSDIPRSTDLIADVNADGTIQETDLTRATFTMRIRYKPGATTTPFYPSGTPIPTETPTGLFDFEFIRLFQVTDTDAVINTRATDDAQVTIRYGRDPYNLNNAVENLTFNRSTSLELANLIPNTQYYFTVEIVSESGERRVSDLLSFTTAGSASIAEIEQTSIFWNQLLLSSLLASQKGDRPYNVFAPKDNPVTVAISFDDGSAIEEAVIRIEKKGVLGISSFKPEPSEIETRILETLPDQFVGELLLPKEVGEYHLILTVKDIYGGFSSEILPSDVFVMNPITVVDAKSGKVIEGAHTNVYIYSRAMQLYTNLDESVSYEKRTDEDGMLELALAEGKYKASVSAIGYEDKKVNFEINESHPYPTIELEPSFSFASWVTFYTRSLEDLSSFLNSQFSEIVMSSYGRSGLLVIAAFITFVLIGTVAFGRIHISFLLMPFILIYVAFASVIRLILHGRGINVYAVAPSTLHSLLLGMKIEVHGKHGAHLKDLRTDIAGSVYIPRKMWEENGHHLNLVTEMEGFKKVHFDIGKEFHSMRIRVSESHRLQGLYHILDHLLILLNFGLFFSGILFISLIISWMFFTAGFMYSVPFLVLNLVNFLAMYLYVKDVSHIINDRGYI